MLFFFFFENCINLKKKYDTLYIEQKHKKIWKKKQPTDVQETEKMKRTNGERKKKKKKKKKKGKSEVDFFFWWEKSDPPSTSRPSYWRTPDTVHFMLSKQKLEYITKTCLYNFDPLKPHFYIVKLGFTGVCIIFLVSAQNIDCGYSLEPPRRGGSNEYPPSRFCAEIWKISEFFIWKFSVFGDKIFLYIWMGVFS